MLASSQGEAMATSSLPPKRPGDAGLFEGVARLLISGCLALGWLVPPGLAATAEQRTVPVAIGFPRGVPPGPISLWVAGSDGQENTFLLPPGTEEHSVQPPGAPPWQLQARSPGFWSAPHTVDGPPAAPLRLEVWPAAEVTLSVHLPPGQQPPGQLEVVLTPAQEELSTQPPGATVHCPLEDGRVKRCVVPAGSWHLRLQAGGFAPHLLWSITIPPQGLVELGQVEFRPGATLAGRVEGPAQLALEAVTVEITPARPDTALGGQGRRAAPALTRQVGVNPWGYFALPGVEAGAWVVRARHPECSAPPLTVTINPPQGLMELPRPLTLLCPAALTVIVTPPESIPAGGLGVEVYRWDPHEEAETPAAAGEVPSGGGWRSPPLPAGTYLVTLSSPSGGTLATQEAALAGEDVEVEIPLRLLVVSGRVLEGRKGLAAKLEFTTGDGATASAQSDEDGHFSATFPRPGSWRPFVRLGEGRQLLALPAAEVKAGETLTLRLPLTRVRGEVRQGDGLTPAPAAQLELLGPDGALAATATADRAGRFELRGVPTGRLTLTASAEERRSRPLELELSTAQEIQVILVLEEGETLRLRVVGAGGPLAGAQLLAWGADAAGRLLPAAAAEAVAGADGMAAVTLPPGVARAGVAVLAPGFALHETPPQPLPPPGQVVEVRLEQSGGTLLLDPHLFRDDHAPLLFQDGRPLVVSGMLGMWAALHGRPPVAGQPWEIPMLPPGRYRLCRLTPAENLAVLSGQALPRAAACSQEGVLAPGGTLRLSLADS